MRPRVGVSACLLGEAVRYDGGHKHSDAVNALRSEVELIPLCPEVELGMGVLREPVELVAAADGPRMIARSGRDWTDAFSAWATEALSALPPDLCGWILKSRSPSCGLEVPVAGNTPGPGLFARALLSAWPDLPVIEAEALADPEARRRFLDRVHARAG